MDSKCDGTMKPYKEKNHTNPDPINIICSISLIHFFSSIIIANAAVHPPPGVFAVGCNRLL
jgi:hypothetical protein